jgi:hypothetical protein
MNRVLALILGDMGLFSLSIAAAITLRQQATQVRVTGHVYETAKLEPTDNKPETRTSSHRLEDRNV